MLNERAVNSFRDLIAWQKAMDLAVLTYEMTASLPVDERFGLTSQMRRCAISISSNVAEGWGRDTKDDYIRFLQTARGSALELSSQAEVCQRLEYAGEWSRIIDGSEECARILNGLIQAIRRSTKLRRSARDEEQAP